MTRTIVLAGADLSGKRGKALEEARQIMAREGLEVLDIIPMDELDRIQSWIDRPSDERPVIVAAGGDGTVSAIANYVATTDAVMGILPLGTSNDVARSLKIPIDLDAAVVLLKGGVVARVDVGHFVADGHERRVFVHAAALGLNARFARLATEKSFRKRLGPFTYLAAALLAVRKFEPFDCELIVGEREETLHLIHLSIVNAPVFGGVLGLEVPGSKIDDHRLDVLAIDAIPLRKLLRGILPLLAGRHHEVEGFHVYHIPNMRIRSQRPLDVTLDGELAGRVPGDFLLDAESLNVITPRHFAQRGETRDLARA